MPSETTITETNFEQLKKYFDKQIDVCKKHAERSKNAKAIPVNLSYFSIDEYVKRRNEETCGEDSFNNLKKRFSAMKPHLTRCTENELNYIEQEIDKAMSEAL